MPSDHAQMYWNSVLALVQDGLRRSNSERQLEFKTIPHGFKVWRELPFLAVERWLDDNEICGRSETKGRSGRVIPGALFPPLTVTGENEASWPEDPLRKTAALTPVDVAKGTLDLFK